MNVGLGRRKRDHKPVGYLPVREAGFKKLQNLELAFAQGSGERKTSAIQDDFLVTLLFVVDYSQQLRSVCRDDPSRLRLTQQRRQ